MNLFWLLWMILALGAAPGFALAFRAGAGRRTGWLLARGTHWLDRGPVRRLGIAQAMARRGPPGLMRRAEPRAGPRVFSIQEGTPVGGDIGDSFSSAGRQS